MKFWKWLLILFFSLIVNEACRQSRYSRNLRSLWFHFKKTYHKKYHRREECRRWQIWNTALWRIIKHNAEYDLGQHTYRMGINKYSDLTHEEFVSKFNGFRITSEFSKNNYTRSHHRSLFHASNLPAELDYRKKKMVTAVKDQAGCGCCWAFSAVAALESQLLKKGERKMVDLSEQNLVDCSSSYGNKGCRGGQMTSAFEYIIYNGGIEAENSYPYKAKEGKCRFRESNVAATCSSYEEIPYEDEDSLLRALVNIGPISVAIDANRESFQHYKGGIYDDSSCSSRRVNHGVLLIGYGKENELDYWLIKNSYGTTWGENGYVKIARNKNNRCGIATWPSYPVL